LRNKATVIKIITFQNPKLIIGTNFNKITL
jgi:hypothetical protein